MLHNYLRRRDGKSNDRRYIGAEEVDREDREGHVVPGAWRAQGQAAGIEDAGRLGSNGYSRTASSVREKFAAYFTSPQGSVHFQDRIIFRGSQPDLGARAAAGAEEE